MKEILLKILAISYLGVGIFGIFAYWPTIKDLYFYKKPSANVLSFSIWVITTGIALLYSLFILTDLLFRFVSLVNFVACVVVLFLRINLKDRR